MAVTQQKERPLSTEFKAGYALLIAVDENAVARWALPVAALDVAALHAVLVHPQRCAYPAGQVRVVSGQAATRQGILDGLQWLAEQLAADASGEATAIVYYSGHGWREETAGEPAYYFIPYDIQEKRRRATALRAADFAEAIAALEPRRLLVALDCCHAGGMGVKDVDATPFTPAAPPPALFMAGRGAAKALDETGLAALQRGQGRAVLVSSSGAQASYVRPDATMSIFTYHLIEALTGHAQPAGGAREVLASDVLSHVYRTVPRSARAAGRTQQPDGRLDGTFPVALLLGGQGLAKGEPAPDPLAPLPGGGAPGMTFHNEGMQAERVNQAQTIYEHSAHAEGGGDATTYNVSGGGVVATGGSVAAGKGGVAVSGDVHGDITIGGGQGE